MDDRPGADVIENKWKRDRSRSPRVSARTVRLGVIAALGLVTVALVVAAAVDRRPGVLTFADAVVLGVVEGITEYLPVSSTGHLTVTMRLLGITGEGDTSAADSYAIAIQLGAILAVLGLYRERITAMVQGLLGRNPDGLHLALSLALAFVPAGSVAFLFEDTIKGNLFGIWPVVAAWAVGGAVILLLAPRLGGGVRALEQLTYRDALLIGAAQIFAMWPGVSRSLTTILAALAVGLAARAAVEFSFLLGLLTLGTATIYEGIGSGGTIVDEFGLATPLVGVVAALVSAVVAVRWLVEYLNRRSLAVFGWYRLGIAVVVGGLALASVV